MQAQTSQSLYDGCYVAIGQRQRLDDLSKYTHIIEVSTYRNLHLGVALCHDTNQQAILFRFANQRHT